MHSLTRLQSRTALSGSVLLALLPFGRAQEADVRPDTEIVAEQYLLLGTATRGSGESHVAVNPRNPNQIAVAAMGVLHTNEGRFEHREFEFRRSDRAVINRFAVSRDRGLTWTVIEDPMRQYFGRYRFLDPFAEFANDGTMILGGEAHFCVNADAKQQIDEAQPGGAIENNGGVELILSTDGGRTFSQPIEIFSSWVPKEVLGPNFTIARTSPPADAPKLKIDRSTGDIYMVGRIDADNPKRPTLILRASKDRARSWGMVYCVDSPEWLSGAGSGSHDATNGVLAVCYLASAVPAELKIKTPVMVFETSKDGGKTFARHVVPGTSGDGKSSLRPGLVFSDPTKPGHYSVAVEADNQIVVHRTEDMGATWVAPLTVAKGPGTSIANLAGRMSERGELALSWRVIYHDPKNPVIPRLPSAARDQHEFRSTLDLSEIWVALSRDGGQTFSAPLKVSSAPTLGASRRRGNQDHSSDFDSVAIDTDFVHLSWFDSRSGFLGTWYGRVPLADFK